MVAGISGVQIGPGATLLARMPFGPSIWAMLPMKFAIAAFVAAYGRSVGAGWSDCTDVVAMIDAPGFMWGTAALVRLNSALRLVASVWSHSSSGISSIESRDIW